MFKSTGKYVEVDTGEGSLPIPIQEVKLTTTSRGTRRETSIRQRQANAKIRQKAVSDAYESYARTRQTISKPFFGSRISRVSRVSRVSALSRVSRLSQVSSLSRVSSVSQLSAPSRVSRVPQVSSLSRVTSVSQLSAPSRVSRVTGLSRVSGAGTTRPPQAPRFNKPFRPRAVPPTLKTRRLGKRYTPSVTALFRTRNIFKLGKRSTGIGVTSGLGVRF